MDKNNNFQQEFQQEQNNRAQQEYYTKKQEREQHWNDVKNWNENEINKLKNDPSYVPNYREFRS